MPFFVRIQTPLAIDEFGRRSDVHTVEVESIFEVADIVKAHGHLMTTTWEFTRPTPHELAVAWAARRAQVNAEKAASATMAARLPR